MKTYADPGGGAIAGMASGAGAGIASATVAGAGVGLDENFVMGVC